MKKHYYYCLHPTPYTLFLVVLILLLPTAYTLHPAFMDTGWGTRAGGMGNAFTAVANDPTATLWNPAGISQIEMLETTFMYHKLFAGIDDVNLTQMLAAGVYPTKTGAFGLTITDFALWGFYRENMISASYSRDFAELLKLNFPIMAGLISLTHIRLTTEQKKPPTRCLTKHLRADLLLT